MTDGVPNFVLTAPSSVTMRGVAAFAADLLEACLAHDHVTLDIDAMTQADLSFVQTVHAGREHMQGKDGTLTLAHPAGEMVASLLVSAGFAGEPADVDFWFHGELPQ